MARNTRLGLVIFCLSIALPPAAVSAAGVFWRGTGATILATSIRGERLEVTTDGVYPFNARRIVAEGVGWDLFTLFAAVPALIAALPGLLRGFLLGPVFVVKAVALASAICAMILGAWSVEGRLDSGAPAFFGVAAAASAWLRILMYRSLP